MEKKPPPVPRGRIMAMDGAQPIRTAMAAKGPGKPPNQGSGGKKK